MATPRVLVLRAPGTNCDRETAHAFERAGAQAEIAHINRLTEAPDKVKQFQILCLPGGFSYGDDVAAGKIFATQIQHHLRDAMQQFKDQEKLVLGICNGFQAILKSGLLFQDDSGGAPATLTWNDRGKYEDRWVNLRVASPQCVFLQGVERLYLPVAHAEGKFVTRDAATFNQLEEQGSLVLRYARPDQNGELNADVPFPFNPNGSQANVAGVCDTSGRIFGLMPHPERYMDVTNHPRWSRGDAEHDPLGLVVFENAVRYFR